MPRLFVCLRCTFLFFARGFRCCRQQRFAASCWAGGKLCWDSAVSLDDGVLWYDGRCLTDSWDPLLNVTHKTHLFTFYLSIYLSTCAMYISLFGVNFIHEVIQNLVLCALSPHNLRPQFLRCVLACTWLYFALCQEWRQENAEVWAHVRIHLLFLQSLSGQIELSYRSQPIPCSGLWSATLCLCVCMWAVICFCRIHGLRAAWLDRPSVIRPCLYLWAEALWAPRAVRVSHCAAVKSSLSKSAPAAVPWWGVLDARFDRFVCLPSGRTKKSWASFDTKQLLMFISWSNHLFLPTKNLSKPDFGKKKKREIL